MLMPTRLLTGFLLFASLNGPGTISTAHAGEAETESAASVYQKCAEPVIATVGEVQHDGAAGFGVTIDNAPYYFMIANRDRFTVNATKDGLPVADVLVDSPSAELFVEQSERRSQFMKEVARRAAGVLEHRKLGGNIEAMTTNKPNLTGKFVGLSLIIDPVRKVMIQWNWYGGERYARTDDVRAFQESIWKTLSPCLQARKT